MSILIKSARIIDAKSDFNGKTQDILIEKGVITKISSSIKSDNAKIINLKNLHVSPGWIDSSVCFGEPGYEDRETIENGTLTATGSQQSMTLSELARSSYQPEVSKALGRPGLSVYSTYSGNSYNYPSCCQVCEVEIDPATGVVELINHVAVADVGRIINPLLVDGQIMGGITQALGQVFMENHQCDEETGQLLSGSFMDYAMPRAEDFCEVDISYHPTFTENNPLGAKGVGEIGTASAMPAAVNAVLNALKDYNTRHLDMPLTSEKIWNSIVDGS